MEKIIIRKIDNIVSPATFYTFFLIALGFMSQTVPGILAYVLPALVTMTIGLLNALGLRY